MRPFQLSKPYGAGWLSLLLLSLMALLCGSAFAKSRSEEAIVRVSGSAISERRVALVIGNGAYDISPLNNPPNDARDVAGALTRLGFDVVHRNNLHRPEMLEAIIDFGISLKKGGVGLFYYAGHGVQVGDKNYLMPIGARIPSTSYVPVQAVDLDMVLAGMTDARNRLNIVILDACRNNPYPKTIRASGAGLAAVMAPSGTVVAYSTAPGKVASDGSGANGLYTSELLRQMTVPGLKIEEMFKRVRAGVYRRSNHKQTPWEHSSLMGDFYFQPGNSAGVVPPPPPPPEPPKTAPPPPSFGVADLHVTTEPSEAVIYLDGQRKGRSPETFQMIPAGRHKLAARKGYLVASQEVALARDDLKRVHLKLEHEKGSLRVFSEPSGATLYIDGQELGPTPYLAERVLAGVRNIELRLRRGGEVFGYSKKLEIKPQAQRLHAELVQTTGSLRLFSEPSGAMLSLDGKQYSPTPVRISGLNAGTHKVLLSKTQGNEYYEYKGAITIKPGPNRETLQLTKSQIPGRIKNGLGQEYVLIQPGSFMMGSNNGNANEKPVHRVTISKPFYMQTTEVTQGQWRAVMGNNPSHFKGDDLPVEQVSWNDVQEYIGKLNAREGGNKYRLPTESEWEYACRAGTTTPFHTGNNITTDQANYNGNYPMPGYGKGEYRQKTLAVKSFRPNRWGLYDMHGNVWEWVQDWYGNYPSGSVTDPKGPGSGTQHMLRGGSWCRGARNLRSANRSGSNPGDRRGIIGFRLAKDK